MLRLVEVYSLAHITVMLSAFQCTGRQKVQKIKRLLANTHSNRFGQMCYLQMEILFAHNIHTWRTDLILQRSI